MLITAKPLGCKFDNDFLTTRQLTTFSDAVYEFCAADCYNTLVQRIVTHLPRLVSMDSCSFFPLDDDEFHFISAEFNGLDQSLFAPYQAFYEKYDLYKRVIFSMTPRPSCNRSSDYMDYAQWAMNSHRAEFLLPNGIYHLVGLQIFAGNQVIGTCGLYRDVGADFSDNDMRLLNMLQRHINQAFANCRYAIPSVSPLLQTSAEWGFTEREMDIANLITQGISNVCVAARLHISINTAKTHIKHVLEKSGCHNRAELTFRMNGKTQH